MSSFVLHQGMRAAFLARRMAGGVSKTAACFLFYHVWSTDAEDIGNWDYIYSSLPKESCGNGTDIAGPYFCK